MDFTYKLTEIQQVIDNYLSKERNRSANSDTPKEHLEPVKSSFPKTEGYLVDTCDQSVNAVESEQEGLEYWTIVDSPLQSSTPLGSENFLDTMDILRATDADVKETVETVTVDDDKMKNANESVAISTNESFSTMEGLNIKSEDMSLKLVLTYFYYMDTSAEITEDSPETENVNHTDKLTTDEATGQTKETSEDITEFDVNSSAGASKVSDSEADFADTDSLDETESGSYKLTSFSMMNVFDTTCDNNYDFTGSLDFKQLCREPCSDSKETLDWLSDSSDEDANEDREGVKSTESDLNGNECASVRTSICSGIDSHKLASEYTEGDSKHYSGSTYTISKSNSEIRYKLVKRLFRKVFPSKKYVVNKK